METLRYLNKNTNLNERQNFDNWLKEQINIYGQEIDFYTNLATLSSFNFTYGENVASGYALPQKLTVLLNLNNDSYLLSKFGIIADSDLNGIIHPDNFTKVFGVSAEPKAGDLMKLTEFGIDRLNYPKRGPTIYELTEVIDEFQINPLGGHYVWFFKAKRYDYSYEPGSPGPGDGNTSVETAEESNSLADQLAVNNFDYDKNPCSNPLVYGDY
jgi:hypothetical protein